MHLMAFGRLTHDVLGGIFSATKPYLGLGLHRGCDSLRHSCSLAVVQHAAYSLDFEAEKFEFVFHTV